MLKERLMDDLKSAMKEKDEIKKNTVQMVRAAKAKIGAGADGRAINEAVKELLK